MAYYTPKRAAVYMLCDLLRAGLRALLADLGVEAVAAADAAALRRELRLHPAADVLIADAFQLAEAVALAAERGLPLLVITPTLAHGLSIAHDEAFGGVIALPLTARALAGALAAVVQGERFLPLDVLRPIADDRLSLRERQLIALDLRDVPTDDIARWMEVKPLTLYTYRNRLRKKLRRFDPADLPDLAREWLRRFPGQTTSR